MNKKEMTKLSVGDIVSHNSNDKQTFVVIGNYVDHAIAVDVVHISNPREWFLVRKANYEEEKSK